jgi:xanthine dehydrogenase accessory factor
VNLEILKKLNEERANRRAAIVVTNTATGAQRFVRGEDVASDPLSDFLQKHIRSAKSGMEETPEGEVFLTVHVPPPKLLIIGAVHISQALAPMAKMLDYDVTIVDPRTAFATPERFPDAKLIADWPENVLPNLGVDRYTAVVLVTHDPKIDDPALIHALECDCFYIGALGSRKTHAKRLERMKARGFGDNALSRIHAPIGLSIGAISPPEIAVAILGEITANLRLEPKAAEA